MKIPHTQQYRWKKLAGALWILPIASLLAALLPTPAQAQAVKFEKIHIDDTEKEVSSIGNYLYLWMEPGAGRKEGGIFAIEYSVNGGPPVRIGGSRLLNVLYSASAGGAFAGTNDSRHELEYILVGKGNEACFRLPAEEKWEDIHSLSLKVKLYVGVNTMGSFRIGTKDEGPGSPVFVNLSTEDYGLDESRSENWLLDLERNDIQDLMAGKLSPIEARASR